MAFRRAHSGVVTRDDEVNPTLLGSVISSVKGGWPESVVSVMDAGATGRAVVTENYREKLSAGPAADTTPLVPGEALDAVMERVRVKGANRLVPSGRR